MTYLVSWSGGKDSCFAGYLASLNGYKISYIVNFISKETKRVSFHGTDARLIQLQSEATGIPILQKETSWEGYEKDFKEAVTTLKPQGIKGMIFGDIYIEEHRTWVERVCHDLGIEAVLPLWGKDPEEILSQFIDSGFTAVLVSAQLRLIDKKWMGHPIDRNFMSYLKERKIDICGENGEYHSLVVDGPTFKRILLLKEITVLLRDNRWFLDIIKYELSPLKTAEGQANQS